VWDFTRGLAPCFEQFYVHVPHSEDDFEKTTEEHGNISIRRFTYFFRNRWQWLCYRGGGPSNLKNSVLAKLQVPFFFAALIAGVLGYRRKVDVVFCHWLPTMLAGYFLKLFFGTRLVVILHGSDVRGFPDWLVRFLLNRADAAVTGHEEILEKAKQSQVSTPCHLIRNFISLERFKNPDRSKKKRILFPSRLYPMKDPMFFLRVAEALEKKGVDVDCVMLGDGELRGHVEKFLNEKKLKRTTYLGPRTDVIELMLDSQMVFFSDTVENLWSTVILEAVFSHCVCVMNDVGMTRSVFEDGINCVLYQHLSIEDCVQKIEALLGGRYDEGQMTRNAIKSLDEQGFTPESVLRKHLAYLRDLEVMP
jgi:glycosyltransferase involved in cell wall biosynthesis